MLEKTPDVATVIEDIKRERDELRVRLHLAKADARDEWERLERKWEHLSAEMKAVGREAARTAGQIGTALGLAADELRSGYRRIREML